MYNLLTMYSNGFKHKGKVKNISILAQKRIILNILSYQYDDLLYL